MSDAEEGQSTASAPTAMASMAASIPPPSPMCFTGDWSSNWDVFRAEYEDYVLVTGIAEKDKKIQAATLRSVMGSECRHVYRHNLSLTVEQREDPAAILGALEGYFKPAKKHNLRKISVWMLQTRGERIGRYICDKVKGESINL